MKAFIFYGMESDFGFHWTLLLLLLPLIHRLWWDWKTIVKDKEEPIHIEHFLVSVGLMFLCAWGVWKTGPEKYLIQPFLFGGTIFLMLFDYLLNLLRGKSWWYIDEGRDGKSSWTDQAWLAAGVWGTLFIKLAILLIGFSTEFFLSYAL